MATQVTARETVSAGAPAAELEKRPATWYVLQVLRYLFLILITIILLGPLVLAFFGSFKTTSEVLAWPPKLLPTTWAWSNYVDVWNNVKDENGNSLLPRWVFNSVLLSVVHVILQLFFCSLAAFAFARMRFRGRNLIFAFMLSTMMIPGAVLLIPRFLIVNGLGLVNTYWAMILPFAVTAFGIFLLTQFLRSIPRDLEEAAMIDGAGTFTIYWRIILPLAKPALATLAILEFQGMWNNFQDALIFLNTLEMNTIPLGLAYLRGTYITFFNLILAGSMFNTIPVLIIFILFSRYIIQGVAYSGVKG